MIFLNRYQLYIFLYFFLFLCFSFNSQIFNILLLVVYLFVVILIEIRMVLRNIKFMMLFFMLSVVSILTFLFRDYYINASLSFYLFPMFIIVQILVEKRIGYKIFIYLILLYSFFIFYRVLSGVDLDAIMLGRSRNMVSFYYIILTCMFYIEYYRIEKKVILFPAVACLFLSLFLIGRSGILTSFILFVFILGFKLYTDKKHKSLIFVATSSIFLFFVFQFYSSYIYPLLQIGLSRFIELRLDGAGREDINSTYFSEMLNSATNFIIGVKLDHPIFAIYKYNLHNSFMSAHYFFGIFVLFILSLIFYAFLKGKAFLYKAILLVLLFRSFFDQVFFIDFMDVVIFYLIFLLVGIGKKWSINLQR